VILFNSIPDFSAASAVCIVSCLFTNLYQIPFYSLFYHHLFIDNDFALLFYKPETRLFKEESSNKLIQTLKVSGISAKQM
jgi:hypothetical protein